MKNIFLNLIALIFGLSFSICTLELFFRAFDLPNSRPHKQTKTVYEGYNAYRITDFDDALWEFIPNNHFTWNGISYSINNYGFRHNPVSISKPTNFSRIMMIGDSVTFGLFVKDINNTFSSLLEVRLNNQDKINVEVINAGVSGYKVQQYTSFFQHHGKQFLPDLVIINFSPYDCEKSSLTFPKKMEHFGIIYSEATAELNIIPIPFKAIAFDNSYFYRFLNYHLNLLVNQQLKIAYPFQMRECSANLKNIITESYLIGAQVMLVHHSFFIGNSWKETAQSYYSKKLRPLEQGMLQSLKVDYVDMQSIFYKQPLKPTQVSFDLIHPNEAGNSVIADAILNKLHTKKHLLH